MGQTLEIAQNIDADWEIDLDDLFGADVTGFTDTDTLSADVWPGGGAPSAFAPTVTWIDSSTGRIRLTVAASQTMTLGVGVYAMQVWVTANGVRRMGFDGALSISRGRGAETVAAGRAYTTFDRMKTYASFLQLLHDPENDQAGYQLQIEEASRWLEGLAMRHYRPSQSSTAPLDYSLDHMFLGIGYRRSLLPAKELIGWLAAGGLMTTYGGVDLGVMEVVAKYAVGLVCQSKIGIAGGGQWASLAADYLNAAEEKAKALTLCIDTDMDGVPNVWIDLGSTDTIYG